MRGAACRNNSKRDAVSGSPYHTSSHFHHSSIRTSAPSHSPPLPFPWSPSSHPRSRPHTWRIFTRFMVVATAIQNGASRVDATVWLAHASGTSNRETCDQPPSLLYTCHSCLQRIICFNAQRPRPNKGSRTKEHESWQARTEPQPAETIPAHRVT